jgi:hypothetical protein
MKKWMIWPVAVAAIGAAAVGVAVSSSTGIPGSAGADNEPAIAMTASATTPAESSIVLAMGRLNDPSNTFWEVFLRPRDGTSWMLHTPPGVASNGGLVVAAPPTGPLTVGFMPSAELRFSPIAQSSDGGDTWSPGELPFPLIAAPDALAVGPRGDVLALVAKDGQRLVGASDESAAWHTLTSVQALKRYTPSCDLRELTAVAFDAASQPVLGLGCDHAGEIGILAPIASSSGVAPSWHSIGPKLGGVRGAASVIRLESTANGPAGLAQVRTGNRVSLVAFWSKGTNQWSRPVRVSVPAGWSVKATATGGGVDQGFAVLLGSGERRRVEVIAGSGSTWTTIPLAPPGAGGVSDLATEVDTFVATGSRLAVWGWTSGAASWHRIASINVPVPYGSSS